MFEPVAFSSTYGDRAGRQTALGTSNLEEIGDAQR